MLDFARRIFYSNKTLWLVYILAAVAVSALKWSLGVNAEGYTAYENYVIFKNSFTHLINGQNPYADYVTEQWDLFKYSPTFALAMAPFSLLPDWLGLPLWNTLNATLLLGAILKLPLSGPRQRQFMAWFVLPELIISLQNSQSNGLTAAFLLWAFIALENYKPQPAAAWTAAGGFLKIFGIFAAAPALVYPNWRSFVPVLTGWLIVLLMIPLIAISPRELMRVYGWWWELLRTDHDASLGLSVLGWLQSWFGWQAPKLGILAAGMMALAASVYAVGRRPDAHNRRLLWAGLLIWVVIFNHKAESPTFVIALCGAALWYLSDTEAATWKKVLLWTAFALASLSPTDLFPRYLREQWIQPYVLKAVPCIAIWIAVTWQLLFPPKIAAQTATTD